VPGELLAASVLQILLAQPWKGEYKVGQVHLLSGNVVQILFSMFSQMPLPMDPEKPSLNCNMHYITQILTGVCSPRTYHAVRFIMVYISTKYECSDLRLDSEIRNY
jgi:hypothetical protein